MQRPRCLSATPRPFGPRGSTNTHIRAVCCVPSEESVANALHGCGVSQVSRVELTSLEGGA